ncbi:MAG: YitT family protein, partial [Smithellaceae bacterium]|nr:YitT family protein [Smithellaceae bacterium]
MNVPLFIAGWFFVSRRFLLYSTLGMFIFAAAVELIQAPIPIDDKLLSAIMAGIIIGLGAGLILKSLGSSGGVDILAVIMMSRFSLRLGTTIIIFNIIVLAAAAWLFSLKDALYTLIYLYVSSQIINLVVNGLSQRKAIMIVSPAWKRISQRIMEEIHRGLTVIHGQGGYSEKEQEVLYTVVTLTELALLKQIVRQEDANAFVVITETAEVMGHRIGNQPHW